MGEKGKKYAQTLTKLSASFHFSINCKRLKEFEQRVSEQKEDRNVCK